jgi:DNA primase
MYNVLAFRNPSDVIAICEGEIDTITANTLCGIPAVGLAGVNAWRPFYARAFLDYQRVLVLADGDQPGKELGKKIASVVEQAIVIPMPDGMDVNATYMNEGADGIRRRAGV